MRCHGGEQGQRDRVGQYSALLDVAKATMSGLRFMNSGLRKCTEDDVKA